MFRAITLVTFAAATFLGSASYANTLPTPAQKQIAVNYADLDISRRAGAEILITRMSGAAAQVCGPAPDVRDLVMYPLYRACVAETLARGVASVNSPMVTELYQGENSVGVVAALRK
jgi:UrcA family protein